MPRYAPAAISHPDSLSQRDLVQYLQAELEKVGATIQQISEGRQDVVSVTPSRPRQGQTVFADGVNFGAYGMGSVPAFFDGTYWKTVPGFTSAGSALLPNGAAISIFNAVSASYYSNYNPITNLSKDGTKASWAISLGAALDNFRVYRAQPTAGTPTFAVVLDVESTGRLALPLGQILFPATQIPSANPNTLDDYEEGNFTPVLRFGGGSSGITYATQLGSYTKVGRLVTWMIRIFLTSKGVSTGVADIAGLPFATSNSALYPYTAGYISGLGAVNNASGYASSTLVALLKTSAGTTAGQSDTDWSNSTQVILGGQYETA